LPVPEDAPTVKAEPGVVKGDADGTAWKELTGSLEEKLSQLEALHVPGTHATPRDLEGLKLTGVAIVPPSAECAQPVYFLVYTATATGRRWLYQCCHCGLGPKADWQTRGKSTHSLWAAKEHSPRCRGLNQPSQKSLINFIPQFCPNQPNCSLPFTRFTRPDKLRAHVSQCKPFLFPMFGMAPPLPLWTPAAAAAAAAAAGACPPAEPAAAAAAAGPPAPPQVPHHAHDDRELRSVRAATAAVRMECAETIKMLEAECATLRQQLQLELERQAASAAGDPSASSNAKEAEDAAATQKRQLMSELAAVRQQLREERDRCGTLEEQLNEATKRRAEQPVEELADAESDKENSSGGSKRARKGPLLAGEFFDRIWLRDATPLGASEQGGLAEVGVGEVAHSETRPKQMRAAGLARAYTPAVGRGEAEQSASKYLAKPEVRLYKMTYAHKGELRHASSELRAMRMLSDLNTPYFPRLLGEAGIITASKEEDDQDSPMVDNDAQPGDKRKKKRAPSSDRDKDLR
jgi:hypothetical protein